MLLPIRWPSRSHGTWLSAAHGQQVGDLVRIGDVMNLRSQINDARLQHGLGVYQFTDPTLTPMVTPTRTVHLDELRTALGEVYAQAFRGRMAKMATRVDDPLSTDAEPAPHQAHPAAFRGRRRVPARRAAPR